jgi:hypothetical protein
MGFFCSKPRPIMKDQSTMTCDQSTMTCDQEINIMELAILNHDLDKVKQLSKFKYNVSDCIFLAVKEGQIEILRYLRNNLQIPRRRKKVTFKVNESINMCK